MPCGCEFLRNQRFDAKNFFDPPGPIIPFNRNIFGYSAGVPVIKDRTFFFTSYEGRVGLEVASIRTLVPSEAQRATVTNPIVRQLLGLVPAANDPTGTYFVGSAPRDRRQDQWTGRVDHNWSSKDFLYGSFVINRDNRIEPTLQGNNLPGFGDQRPAQRYFLSLGDTRILSPSLTNELRAGFNRLRISFNQAFTEDPSTFGIASRSTVFPNVTVPGAMSFGGINGEPQGRGDNAYQYNDTAGWIPGRHSIRMGGEFRRFANNDFHLGTGGILTFGTIATFLAGTPTQATQTSLPVTPSLHVNAFGAFVQDDYKLSPRLTLNLGLRWEYNGVAYEKHNRLAIYDFSYNSLVPVGANGAQPYRRQFTNFGPRVGFAYDPSGRGKTAVRGGFGIYYDQPTTNIVQSLAQGWSASPIVNLQSGNPFSPIIQVTDTRGSQEAFNRPFLVVGVPLTLPNPSPNQWINPEAFVRQATGFRDAGRNILTGPGFTDVDLSIAKDTKIKEQVSLQFRSEAFNLFNHPNFGQPQNNLAVASFGQITAARTTRGDLGSSRQVQFALKLRF